MTSSSVVVLVILLTVITGVCSQDNPYFLVVSPTVIRKLTNVEVVLPISGLRNAVACDYDLASNIFFFSDVQQDFIKSARLDGTNVANVITTDISTPDGISVDWIAKVIYWTDTGTDVIDGFIDAASYDGSNRVRLISSNLGEPRAIVVHPVEGWMFWTDWGTSPKIERAWMDGTHREAIVTTSLGWPNGLTIDFATRKIYWADAKEDKIEMASFDGSNRRTVLTSAPHPFGLTLYGDYIYWTDWLLGAIEKAQKVTGSGRTNVASGFSKPMDLHIVSSYRQTGTNACAVNNGGCPSLCLMRRDGHVPVCQPEGYDAPSGGSEPETKFPPNGITTPADVQIDDGRTKTVQCSTNSRSRPRTELLWSGKNMGTVHNTTLGSDNGTNSRATLSLIGSQSINEAVYTCTAVYDGHVIYTRTTKVEVHFAPTSIAWYSTPSTLEVRENTVFTLKCRATESSPPVTPIWRKLQDGQTTTAATTSSRLIDGVYGGKIVEITREITASRADSGVLYWCEADFTFLSGSRIVRKSTQKRLHILYPVTTKLTVQSPVKEGVRMLLTCETSGGYPTLPESYKWSFNGQTMSGENAPTLEKNPVSRTDSGTYSCTATNRGGVSTAQQTIDVYYPPEVVLKIIPTSIKEGDHVVMTCSTDGGNPDTMDTYSWKHENEVLVGEHGRTLTRSPFNRNQAGVFECTATNQGGKRTSSKRIEVMYPPDVSISRNTDPVKEGEDLILTCNVTGGNPVTVTSYVWTYNAQILNGENGKALRLPAINRRKSGDYVCTIRTDGGTASAHKTITVMYPPSVIVTLSPAVVVEGDRAVLTCQALQTAGTSITYSWSLDNVKITGQIGRTLVRDPVKRQDAGVYECLAETVGGKESGQKILDVLYKPELDTNQEQLMSVESDVGQKVTYRIYLKARPPTVKVECSSESGGDSRLFVKVEGLSVTVTINAVQTSDYGDHECRVTNSAGSREVQLTLRKGDVVVSTTVGGKPPGVLENESESKLPMIGGAAGGVVVVVIVVLLVVLLVVLVRRRRAPPDPLSARRLSEMAFANRRMSEMSADSADSPDSSSPFDNPCYVSDYEVARRPKMPTPDELAIPRVPSWDPSIYDEPIYHQAAP